MATQRLGAALSATRTTPLLLDETIFDLLPAAVYLCDVEGHIIRFNDKAVELWGRSPRHGDSEERFCGSLRLYWPDGRPLSHGDTPMAEALRSGQPARNFEVQIGRPDGSRIWVLVNIDPIRDAKGNITGAINCFHDITERKQAEVGVQSSQAVLRAIVETTPECIKLVARDGTLLQMNAAGLRMVGAVEESEVEGRSIFDLIAPENREVWRDNHERVCAGETRDWEFEVIGLDGSRRHMQTHAAPLAMADGSIAQLAVTRDLTGRKRSRHALRESERRFGELLEALPMAVYTTDAEGKITFYNKAAVEFWGQSPALGSSLWCGSWRLYRPDGTPLPHDECPMAVALKEQRSVRGEEAIAERPDGTRVPFTPYPTPLFDSAGKLVGAVNMLVDISQHKKAHTQQRLLINELNHRVKNTLATVQSIATITLRHATSPARFRESFSARLLALSGAHNLLTQGNWESAGVRDILSQVLEPYRAGGGERIQLTGENIALAPRTALTLAMATHELATNAAKYGALSSTQGRLAIDWRIDHTQSPPMLALSWGESGGPAVKSPSRKGFGTRFIERSMAQEMQGEARLDFAAEGLRCAMKLPLRADPPTS